MQRFLIQNQKNDIFSKIIDKNTIHQITTVLRIKNREKIILFDGINMSDHIYEITEISKKEIILKYEKTIKKINELDKNIILYQALPNKIDKIELIIQKCTEIGLKEINFWQANRSQKINISPKKRERLNMISKEALEQCNGNILPEINFYEKLDFEKFKNDTNIFCHTDNNGKDISIKKISKENKINLFIGPEGGFCQEEILVFLDNNYIPLDLGLRILRTETAGIVASFLLSRK